MNYEWVAPLLPQGSALREQRTNNEQPITNNQQLTEQPHNIVLRQLFDKAGLGADQFAGDFFLLFL